MGVPFPAAEPIKEKDIKVDAFNTSRVENVRLQRNPVKPGTPRSGKRESSDNDEATTKIKIQISRAKKLSDKKTNKEKTRQTTRCRRER